MNRILVVGNSHSRALKAAGPPGGVAVHWLRTKATRDVGDLDPDDALRLAAALRPDDCLVVMRLGAQHNILGLLNHEVPFALADAIAPGEAVEMIPEALFRAHLAEHAASDRFLAKLAARAPCRVGHVMTPPPKPDLDSASRAYGAYRGQRIASVGFAPAPRRLALWRLEKAVLDEFLPTLGIVPIPPPPGTATPEGYLDPAFAGPDATHANAAYGARLMAQLFAFAAEPAALPERP